MHYRLSIAARCRGDTVGYTLETRFWFRYKFSKSKRSLFTSPEITMRVGPGKKWTKVTWGTPYARDTAKTHGAYNTAVSGLFNYVVFRWTSEKSIETLQLTKKYLQFRWISEKKHKNRANAQFTQNVAAEKVKISTQLSGELANNVEESTVTYSKQRAG